MSALATVDADRVRLAPPRLQRHVDAGARYLFLGFPADTDGRPLTALTEPERAAIASHTARGDTRPRGMWSLVADDGGELVLRTDRQASRPLFWRSDAKSAAISEDIWPLVDSSHELDPHGVADFLLAGHGLGSSTIFAGVHAAEADTILRFRRGAVDRVVHSFEPIEAPVAVADLLDRLEDSLVRCFDPYADEERLVAGLSGGLDSRVIAALAVERGVDVIGWTFSMIPRSREVALARRVARALDLPHVISQGSPAGLLGVAGEFVLRSSAQASLEHIHAYGSERELPDNYGVLATGVWGDHGRLGDFLFPPGTSRAVVEETFQQRLLAGRPEHLQERFLPGLSDWPERVRDLTRRWYDEAGGDPACAELMYARSRVPRMNAWGMASIRPHMEAIAPFMDEELMRACHALPHSLQHEARGFRRVIARRWPALGDIPWDRSGVPLRRDPNRIESRVQSARVRLNSRARRSGGFTDTRLYRRSLSPLISSAQSALGPMLADLGIRLDALLEDHPEESLRGAEIRLRLATIAVALEQAHTIGGTCAESADA